MAGTASADSRLSSKPSASRNALAQPIPFGTGEAFPSLPRGDHDPNDPRERRP